MVKNWYERWEGKKRKKEKKIWIIDGTPKRNHHQGFMDGKRIILQDAEAKYGIERIRFMHLLQSAEAKYGIFKIVFFKVWLVQ